jgi:ABC-2 type transport system permease protein
MRAQLVWVVARMEWRERSRIRTLRYAVYLLAALAGMVTLSGRLHPSTTPSVRSVGVVGALPAGVAELVDPPPQITVEFLPQPDRASAEAGVRSGRLDAAVVDGTVLSRSRDDSLTVVLLRRALPRAELAQRLQSAGVDRGEALALGALPPAPVAVLTSQSAHRKANVAVAQVGVMVGGGLAFFLTTFIASGAQEERGRRMADVLLVPLTPLEVVAGKVVGVEGLGLAVFAKVTSLAAVIALAYDGIHVIPQVSLTVLAAVFWFVLHLALYSCLAVATGARAASPEAAGMASLPAMFTLSIAATTAATVVSTSPNGLVARLGSLFPPTAAPFTLVRAAAGTVGAWEVIVAAMIVVSSIVAMAWLAARFYFTGVVLAGDTVHLRDVLRPRSVPMSARRLADATNADDAETPWPPGASGGVHSPAATDSAAPGRP